MAEVLFRRMASERLGCEETRLLDHGFDAFSAGVAASDSFPASREAIQVLAERGLDLSHHLSQPVTLDMLEKADLILALTPSHLGILQNARPDLADRMRTLRADGDGVADPIGGSPDEYRRCADEITSCLEEILDGLTQKDVEQK